MSRFDNNDLNDMISLMYSILDYARLGYFISTNNCCNDCMREDCEYKPGYGEPVRWNCPLWQDEDDKFKPLMEGAEE